MLTGDCQLNLVRLLSHTTGGVALSWGYPVPDCCSTDCDGVSSCSGAGVTLLLLVETHHLRI